MPAGGDVIYAADVNTRVGTNEATSNVAAASYASETVIDTVTANVVSGKRYQIRAFFPYFGSVAADRFLIRIRTDTTTAGTQLAYSSAQIHSVTGSLPYYTVIIIAEWTAGSTGSQSFCTTAIHNTGTGNLTILGASSQVRLLTVDLLNTA